VVEHLPSKHKALFIPILPKRKKRERRDGENEFKLPDDCK
jgi:hypothetical protein